MAAISRNAVCGPWALLSGKGGVSGRGETHGDQVNGLTK